MIAKLQALGKSHLGKILLQFKREFWIAVVISSVANIMMLAPTIYMLQIFDRVMISQSVFTLVAISGVVVLFYAVQAIAEWLRSKLIVSVGIRIDYALNEPIFRAAFLDQLRTSGKSPVQAFADLTVLRQWLTGTGLFAFLDLPWTPVYVGVMFMLHPWLGLLTIVFMGVLALFAWLSTHVTRDAIDESEEEERELNKFIYSKLQNAEVIEAHGMVPNLRERWWSRQVEMIALQVRASDLQERMTAASKQLRFLMNSLALGAGAFLCIRGELTIGGMIAASLLMSRATSPIDMMVAGWRGLLGARKSFNRLEKLLSEAGQERGMLRPESLSGHLELRGLVATTTNRKEPILKGITASFPPGEIYVILGRSGAGKSTLGKAILGIWPDTQGDVLLDGVDIHHYDRQMIGRDLGYLPQDIELFQGTVAANIARMGEVDPQQVIEAAKRTNTHAYILSLPMGYDSEIGDRGSSLSGGQRQRIALARAIYGTPKLVVLDEPNANLDRHGDLALREAIVTLKNQGSSVFIITHRPNILDLADQVLVMESGQIVFCGSKEAFAAETRAGRAQSAGLASNDSGPPADAEPIPV